MEIIRTATESKKHIKVREADIQNTCDAIFLAMQHGLPEEAHTIEVFEHVLQECKESLQRKKLVL